MGGTFGPISAGEPAVLARGATPPEPPVKADEMPHLDVPIPTPDGPSNGTLHLPAGDGPWRGVLVFPDAGGTRETFRQMGDRLADMGYVTLIPDIYYRSGQWAPF